MKNLSILAVLTISFFFCSFTTTTTTDKNKRKAADKSCVANFRNSIVKEIISNSEIKGEFKLSHRRGGNIKIFENAYIDQNTTVNINYKKVLIVNNPSHYPDALNIDFVDVNCNKETVEFEVSSRTHNVLFKGGLRKSGAEWIVQIFSKEEL